MTSRRAHNRFERIYRGRPDRPLVVKELRRSVGDTRKNTILQLLERRPARTLEIAHDIELAEAATRILLNDLKCEGKITRNDAKPATWRLA